MYCDIPNYNTFLNYKVFEDLWKLLLIIGNLSVEDVLCKESMLTLSDNCYLVPSTSDLSANQLVYNQCLYRVYLHM